tara:strand:- start:730 stop:1110 length:381 start_codon:yes stop_codon:yes gene_type:complete
MKKHNYNESMQYIIILSIIAAILEIATQFLFKNGSYNKDFFNLYFVLGLVSIFVAYTLYYYIVRSGLHLNIVHSLYHIFVIIILAAGSYFIFNQTLNNMQIISVIGILIFTIMLTVFNDDEKFHLH